MVADKLWMEGTRETVRWRSNRTNNQSGEREGPSRPPVSSKATEFADLYEEHARAVLRYCQLRIADPAEAEDAAALIFTRAFSAWPPDDPESARAWLFTIAHHTVANHYRSQTTRGPRRPLDDAIEVRDAAPTPLEQAIARENRAELHAAIGRLSDDQREVVQLRLAGLTGPEIADTLGKSHAAVKMLQLRAVQKLRSLLAPTHATLQENDR
jgi:RNA polymerase sigma-70 factor (ECF subfamily)